MIIVVFGLLGCESIRHQTNKANLSLPNPSALPCCWQTMERLDVTIDEQQVILSSVTVVEKGRLTVVILDPIGQRWVTVTQENSELKIDQSPEIEATLPVEWLVLGIYLRNLPDPGWAFPDSNWAVERGGQKAILLQNGQPKIELKEKTISNQNKSFVELQYLDLDLRVEIFMLSRQGL